MNMIFNASAGTGKTWQVTELYAALVLGRPHDELPADRPPVDPRRILLMTFTDNAAAELRQRVAERMLKARQEDDADLADRARRVLRSLPAANISTIHAFCAGLLREHALELGLSPSFQTLEDEERNALLDEVLKAEIFQCLEAGSTGGPAFFQGLEERGNFREFCAGLSVLGDHEYSLINTIRSLLEKADSRGLNLRNAEAMLPPPEHTVTQQMFEKIHDELEMHDLPKTAADALDALKVFLSDFPNLGKLEAVPKFGQAKKVKHLSDELADLKERFVIETLYAENIEKFQAFARCLAACARSFTEAKRSRDCVDFGDQLLLARDLLKNKKFASPAFEWIIVDEVQDTSRVQCDLIEALWGPQTHLVICGDKKQSIYAWRSADPQVMPDLEAAMEQRGGCKRIDLKKSYRSKDRVIDAVNDLFNGLYDSYDALEPQAVLAGEKPCVEFLDEEGGTTEDEMSAVARRIRLLVDGGEAWRPMFGHDGKQFVEGEPFRYGDILILLKRSTHQPVLEKALRDAGVPYTSGGKGRALFEQQEVRDLLLFLQTLCEPSNDLALVGFLRSPFVHLPDDEIVQLGWDGETFDHEILRKQFLEGGSEAAERLLRYRVQTGGKLPSQLVREMVRETAFDAQLAGQSGGEQKLANFKKALDWIRAAERGGQVLLPDVVRRFEKYIKTPPRSGAAEALLPDPEQNAVTVMTVHSAKGLTQRVCFVPDSSFGDVNEPGFAMFSPQGSLEMSIADLTGGKVESPGWKGAREADKQVRNIELTNVFYVAMTRARDLVVLSGAGTKDPKGWLKQAEGFLTGTSDDLLKRRTFSDVPEFRVPSRRIGVPSASSEFRVQDRDVSFQPLEIPEGMKRRTVTSLCEKNSSFSNHQSSISTRSETGACDSNEAKRSGNPARYGTVGHAVLEELAKNRWEGDVPALVELFAVELGAREGLRPEALGFGEDVKFQSTPATSLVEHLKPKAQSLKPANDRRSLIQQLEAAREVLRKETAGAEALLVEHPFVLKRGDALLDGTIDLLARISSKHWKILDYKFSGESPEAALETYSPQLEAYQEAVQKLNPGAEVFASLVLIGETVQVIASPAQCR